MNIRGSASGTSCVDDDQLRRSIMRLFVLLTLVLLIILISPRSLVPAAIVAARLSDEPSVLPSLPTDQVTIRKAGTHRDRTLSGVIEDMSGQIIVLRRDGNTAEVLKLRDVVSVQFHKSAEFDDGLRKLQTRDWQSALTSLQAAETAESRVWAVREIRASQAVALRAIARFDECLAIVEQIFNDDPDTRHLVELPLVWDERLPAEQRFAATPPDLKSPSVLRQLTAASALLHDPGQEDAAAAALKSLSKSPRLRIQELAELQLWRRSLLRPEVLQLREIEQWMNRVRGFDRRMRSGPEFLIGRALLLNHDYDRAATSLLWMPLLEPLDPATTNASLNDAIKTLNLAGRNAEAAQFQIELDELVK